LKKKAPGRSIEQIIIGMYQKVEERKSERMSEVGSNLPDWSG
jgi:hypothetical protein